MKPKSPIESVIPKLRILTIRDQRVLLDADLARLYGVETRALNQAVKRNMDRFPTEFAFQLTREEILSISQTVTSSPAGKSAALTSQIVISKPGRGGRRYNPYVFTEHGALQAANVTILKRLAEIDRTLLEHDSGLRDVYRKLLPLLQPPPDPPRRRIGFNQDDKP